MGVADSQDGIHYLRNSYGPADPDTLAGVLQFIRLGDLDLIY